MTAIEALNAEIAAIDYALRIKREDIEMLTERRRNVTELLQQYKTEELALLDANDEGTRNNATINE